MIGKRHLLRVAMQERKVESELPLQASSRIQLSLGVVDPDRPSTAPCQPRRHIRGATAKLDHILPADVVGEHPHLRLGHAPHPPRWLLTGPLAPARILVLRRPLVPPHAVPPDVIGKLAHLQHSLIGDRGCADFAENKDDEQRCGSGRNLCSASIDEITPVRRSDLGEGDRGARLAVTNQIVANQQSDALQKQ